MESEGRAYWFWSPILTDGFSPGPELESRESASGNETSDLMKRRMGGVSR
jgi:hypothetical protein